MANDFSFTEIGIFDMPVLKTEGKGKTKKGNIKIHTVLNEHEIKNILSI
jgi:hypothetical protein